MSKKKEQLTSQIQEQKVLESELSSLKKGSKVYKQQQNSNVYFLSDKEKVFSQCKNTLDNLIEEYKEVEKSSTEDQVEENEEEEEQCS